MRLGDVFDVQDEQGVWWRCTVVWSGNAGHYLCRERWPMASSLVGNSSPAPAGSVTGRFGTRESGVISQTAMRA